jgi:hypothetical protein
MMESHASILGFEVSWCEEHEGQWTETSSFSDITMECSYRPSLNPTHTARPNMVTVRVKDVIDALAARSSARPLWLSDFSDDPIAITEDMHQVLVAYRSMRRAA